MALNTDKYIDEIERFLLAARAHLNDIRSRSGIRPFDSLASMSFIHDFLKRSKDHSDKLSRHFSIEHSRQVAREKKISKKSARKAGK